jgi:hypothetical protein
MLIKLRGLARCVARMETRNPCGILVGKPEGETPQERRRRSWEENIKIHRRYTDSLANTIMNISASIKCWEVLE